MLAAVPWGLGWMIFGAREFLNTDVMLAGVFVIGVLGLALEKLVFQKLEEFTVMRWGMMTMTALSDRARSTLARHRRPSSIALRDLRGGRAHRLLFRRR